MKTELQGNNTLNYKHFVLNLLFNEYYCQNIKVSLSRAQYKRHFQSFFFTIFTIKFKQKNLKILKFS